MNGKVAIVLLVLSCFAQEHDATLTGITTVTRVTIDEILKTLNDLITAIRQALERVGKVILDFEQMIQDVLGIFNIPKFLSDLKTRIENIIGTAGITASAASTCVKAEQEAVSKLVSSTTSSVNQCVTEMDPIKSQISGEISNIQSKATAIISNISSTISKCFRDNVLNPLNLLNCLKGMVDPTSSLVSNLIDEINSTVDKEQQLMADATSSLTACVTKVQSDASAKRDAIVAEFQKCVANISQ